MANTLLTIDMITREALAVLENNLVFGRLVNRQYDDSFANKQAQIGSTLRIRKPARYLVTDGPGLQVQNSVEESTTLTVSKQRNVAMNFTTAELTMKIDDFSDQFIKPAVSQLAATIDNDIASVFKQIYNTVGTPGTTPGTSLVLLQAQQKLSELAAPMSPRYGVINPAANAQLVEGLKGLFNPVDVIAKQFRNGAVSDNILDYKEIAMSQSIATHTTGTRSTADTILVNGTISTQGQSTISIDGGTGSATVTEGDVFTVAGVYAVNPQTRQSTGSLQQFVVTAANTASGGAWTNIAVQPAMYTADQALATISAFPQDGAAITFVGAASTAYPQNLVFHKDAITMATCDLVLPTSGIVMGSRQVHNGISMRIIQDYDINNDRMPCRIDVLYGFTAQRPETAVRMWG